MRRGGTVVLWILAGCASRDGSPMPSPDGGVADAPAPDPTSDAPLQRDLGAPPDAPGAVDGVAADTAGPDTAVHLDSVPDVADAEPACNQLAVDKPVEIYQRDVSAPFALGGPIADGRYALHASEIFYGPGGPLSGSTFEKRWGALVVRGGSFEHVLIDQGPPLVTIRQSGTLEVKGTQIILTFSCPAGTPPAVREYTSLDGTLSIYRPLRPGVTEELAYLRQ